MTYQFRALTMIAVITSVLSCGAYGFPAGGPTSRECLNQAAVAAQNIDLAGDQSAARRYVACALASLDPHAALAMTNEMRRPSDAARALGAVAVALAKSDPARARQAADAANRFLLRIVEPARRDQEQRLLLEEIAPLGSDAVATVSELAADEARAITVSAGARSNPAAALALLRSWKLSGQSADRAMSVIVVGLARTDPDRALKLAPEIRGDALRDQTYWQIAEARPPPEAFGIAQRVSDPVVRSAILTSAAVRTASESAESAFSYMQGVTIASDSAKAELAVALAETDQHRALELARGLPERPRRWALGRIALSLAAARPEVSAALLVETSADLDVIHMAAARMASKDPERAGAFARSLPPGEARDAALSAIAGPIAISQPRQACDLVWEIQGPAACDRAAEAVARHLATLDADAATSLIGLISDPDQALRLRALVAARAALRDPSVASRLLTTLPASEDRSNAALEAASSLLQAGQGVTVALQLAELGMKRDLALRWLLPTVASSQAASPINLADSISDAYLRALALADTARRLERIEAKAVPSASRSRMIRPVVEWETL